MRKKKADLANATRDRLDIVKKVCVLLSVLLSVCLSVCVCVCVCVCSGMLYDQKSLYFMYVRKCICI